MFANCRNHCNENSLIECRRFENSQVLCITFDTHKILCSIQYGKKVRKKRKNIKYINKHHHSNKIQKRLVKRFKEILFCFPSFVSTFNICVGMVFFFFFLLNKSTNKFAWQMFMCNDVEELLLWRLYSTFIFI